MTTTLNETELKMLVKEGVREALTLEIMKIRAMMLGFVSTKEQKDVEKRYGKPSRDYVDSYVFKT